MKKMLLLSPVLSALSGASLPAQPRGNHWKLEVEVTGRFQFTLRIDSHPSRGATLHALSLQIMEGSPYEHSLVLFQIGDHPHA
jgi:hypothetical protein